MKGLSLKAIASLGVLGAMTPAAQADLIISQYVEGSSYNKVLEIYNAGTEAEELGDYKIVKYQNGDETNPKDIALDSVSLAAGDVYVITHTSAASELLALAQQTTSSLDFNGDDPVAIVKLSDESTVDFFGEYGDVDFGKDATFVRIDNTAIDNGVWDTSLWNQLDKDDFTGVGVAPGDEDTGSTPVETCSTDNSTPIYDIQGDGSASPLVGSTVFTTGIVTSISSSLFKGFFIQDSVGDGNSATSDGIFIYATNTPSALAIGDEVCISGPVSEYYGLTEVTMKSYDILSSGNSISPTSLALSDESLLHDQLEPYEGMLVTTTDSGLIVSRAFSYDYDAYRNNMVMTYQDPIYKSTHLYVAGTEEEEAVAANNLKSTLFIETDEDADNGVVPYFSGLNAEDGYILVGDTVSNLEGVIGYSYSQYRLLVSDDVDLVKTDFDHTGHDRLATSPIFADGYEFNRPTYGFGKKGKFGPYGKGHNQHGDKKHHHDRVDNLRVASFNVLNLFNSPFGGAANPTGDNRGAEIQSEFDLQITKIANALSVLDADIVGLMEIENNGFGSDSAIAALVETLNNTQPASAAPYAYISAGTEVGTDAIAVGLIYRPSVVKPIRPVVKIPMPEQHGTDINGDQFDKYQRVSLLQTFKQKRTNKTLSVVVNHFKSKGSACIEDSVEDSPQSNCNAFRVSAAVTLGDYLKQNIKGNVLILGDLNSYAKEDPIRVLTDYDPSAAIRKIMTAEQATLNGEALNDGESVEVTGSYGMINLVEHFQGPMAFSYTYDGELGSLDHAIASPSLLKYVVGADDWHINSTESTLFQYSSEYTGTLEKSANPYSSSDHDPVVVEIDFQ